MGWGDDLDHVTVEWEKHIEKAILGTDLPSSKDESDNKSDAGSDDDESDDGHGSDGYHPQGNDSRSDRRGSSAGYSYPDEDKTGDES